MTRIRSRSNRCRTQHLSLLMVAFVLVHAFILTRHGETFDLLRAAQLLDMTPPESKQRASATKTHEKKSSFDPVKQEKKEDTKTVCSGHGSLLLHTCFCDVGWSSSESNCADANAAATPPCGPYDDRCFFHPDYGVAVVSTERWKSAQSFEDETWAEQRTSDRNDEHLVNFAGYSSLLIQDSASLISAAKNTSVLGHMIEIGCGPFTQSLTVFEETGLLPKSITLLEPLAETYMKTVDACRYKTGKLRSEKLGVIEETIIAPISAEQLNQDGSKDEFYDSMLLVNMIEHVQDAFLVYRKAFDSLKPGGLVIFHERYWPGYTGKETKNKREFDLHPIRLNKRFAHWLATEFDLFYEKEQTERGGNLNFYWIGRKREKKATMAANLGVLAERMESHANMLQEKGFDETKIWGNIYNGKDLEQSREYLSYASLPWVKTICEVGFAGGHSTVVYFTANPEVTIYSFDDLGKRQLSLTAYDVLKQQGRVILTEGDSATELPKFVSNNPDVYCDIISVDGAHHEHFPDTDLQNFKYMANYPNIVFIGDYHDQDWPAVTKGVRNRVEEGSMKVRHVAASSITFRDKQKQWAIGEYTLLTVVIATMYPNRSNNVQKLVNEAASHPTVQHVIVLWNTPAEIPAAVSQLARVPSAPGNKMARVSVLQRDTNSLNNRYDPNLPIHTGAVMILDDDVMVTKETFACAMNAFTSDPSRLYSFGFPRSVTKTDYGGFGVTLALAETNFLLPRMIFHRSFLNIYFGSAFDELREYVDTQKGHCDDIAFASVVTKHTGKPMVYIDAPLKDIPLAAQGLTSSATRKEDRIECSRDIITMLDWTMPYVDALQCQSFHNHSGSSHALSGLFPFFGIILLLAKDLK